MIQHVLDPADPSDCYPVCCRCGRALPSARQRDDYEVRCSGCNWAMRAGEVMFPCVSQCCRGKHISGDPILDAGE
jgi:hypothetical protein